MAMRVSETGIDWYRLQPEDFDMVATVARAAAREYCSEEYAYKHKHYTTRGGETVCPERAVTALSRASKYSVVGSALKAALPSKRSVIFSTWVRRG